MQTTAAIRMRQRHRRQCTTAARAPQGMAGAGTQYRMRRRRQGYAARRRAKGPPPAPPTIRGDAYARPRPSAPAHKTQCWPPHTAHPATARPAEKALRPAGRLPCPPARRRRRRERAARSRRPLPPCPARTQRLKIPAPQAIQAALLYKRWRPAPRAQRCRRPAKPPSVQRTPPRYRGRRAPHTPFAHCRTVCRAAKKRPPRQTTARTKRAAEVPTPAVRKS